MTREEAIAELSVIWERLRHPEDCENGCYSFRDGDYLEALDMAIEALSADSVSRRDTVTLNSPISIQAEMVAVVRCKDCRYRELDGEITHFYLCRINERSVDDDDYCAWGERKGGDDE